MKRNLTAIALMCAVLSLTSCGANINITTESQTADAAATTAAPAETVFTETTVPIETSAVTTAAAETSATTAQTTVAETAAEVKAEISPFTGNWLYSSYGAGMGIVAVAADSSFTYTPYDGSGAKTGTVKLTDEQHPDGSKSNIYSFVFDDNTGFIGFYLPENWNVNVLYLGQDSGEKLVRQNEVVTTDGTHITCTDSVLKEAYRMQDAWEDGDFYAVYNCNVPFFQCDAANAAMSANIDEMNEQFRQIMIAQVREYESRNYTPEDYEETVKRVNESPMGNEQVEISYMLDFQGGLGTVFINNYFYGGGAHGTYYTSAYAFDVSQMQLIRSLDKLSASKDEFVNFAVQYFMQNYSDQYGTAPDWTEDILRKAMTEENAWYFSDWYFTVEFPAYSFNMTYADGPQLLQIPLNECLPHLNAYGKELLQ